MKGLPFVLFAYIRADTLELFSPLSESRALSLDQICTFHGGRWKACFPNEDFC